jgi:hypothetical protein
VNLDGAVARRSAARPRAQREQGEDIRGTRLATRRRVKAQALKIVLWTGSVGLIAVVLRRFLRRRRADLNVGNVSEEWLAQHRGSSDSTPWELR